MATNEPTSVNKDRTLGDLALTILLSLRSHNTIKVLVADTAPRLRQRLARLKAALGDGDALHAPLGSLGSALGVQNVVRLGGGVNLLGSRSLGLEVVQVLLPGHAALGEDDDTAGGVGVLARGISGADGRAGRHPGCAGVVHLACESVADERAGASEEAVLVLRLAGRAGGVWVVHVADHRGERDAAVLEALLDSGSSKRSLVVGGDTVVVGVNRFDEVRVQLLVQQVYVGVLHGQGQLLGEDRLTEVHVHQAGGGELGGVLWEGR